MRPCGVDRTMNDEYEGQGLVDPEIVRFWARKAVQLGYTSLELTTYHGNATKTRPQGLADDAFLNLLVLFLKSFPGRHAAWEGLVDFVMLGANSSFCWVFFEHSSLMGHSDRHDEVRQLLVD